MSTSPAYKIIKPLGFGDSGTTYLVHDGKGKRYAMKIQKILHKDVKHSLKAGVWKEIEFAKSFAAKHPNQFTPLIDFWIVHLPHGGGCTIQNTVTLKKPPDFVIPLDKKPKEYYLKYQPNSYCMVLVYELLEGTLRSLLGTYNFFTRTNGQQRVYSAIIQVVWSCYLMQRSGFLHSSVHAENVMYISTTKQYVECAGLRIPTLGYLYKIIDYGEMNHSNYDKKQYVERSSNMINDILLYIIMFNLYPEFDWMNKHKMKIMSYQDYLRVVRKTPAYQYIKTFHVPPEISNGKVKKYKWSNDFITGTLYGVMYPEHSIHIESYGKIKNPRRLLVPPLLKVEDFMFVFKNITQPLIIIKYFYDKLHAIS